MKTRQRLLLIRILFILGLLIALFMIFNLLFRHRVFQHSRATALYEQGQYDKAAALWDKLSGQKDGDPIPESSSGKVRYKLGQAGEARTRYEQALAENAKKPGLHYDLGNALYRGDQLDQALSSYKQAMLLDPDDQDAKSNYELVLRRQGYQPPPPQESEGGNDGSRDQEAKPEDREDKKEQYGNTLDALDQKEAIDRRARQKPKDSGEGGKWW